MWKIPLSRYLLFGAGILLMAFGVLAGIVVEVADKELADLIRAPMSLFTDFSSNPFFKRQS